MRAAVCGSVLLFVLAGVAAAGTHCSDCHAVALRGAHATLACGACHGGVPGEGSACVRCHPGTAGVLAGPMAHRGSERDFAATAFGRYDRDFFAANCNACHLSGCLDCHGGDGHAVAKPRDEDCQGCHRGYFVGSDYAGLAPREDSLRYQRGPAFAGEHYLKMRPDVHAEAGMSCGACHSMASLAAGERSARGCRDCHRPDPAVVEHRIAAHLERLECYACHSAWGAQEYGSFFLRLDDHPLGAVFRVRREAGSAYLRSAYLKRQDAPPLGRNAAGRISPVRPQFIAYYSDLSRRGGVENLLAAAQWKAFFPHTIRRGTGPCDSCHAAPRRFLLEAENRRIYLPERDGMGLSSFWNSRGQTLVNGRFVTAEEFQRLARPNPEYVRDYVEKWSSFIERVADSSREGSRP